MKVSGWEGGREIEGGGKTVEEDESGVEISLAQHLCFHPSTFTTPLLSSPLPSQKNHCFPSSSSRSPPNPPLLHCICFLIRSVWEAHEPFPTLLLLLPPPSFFTHVHSCLSLGGCNAVTCLPPSFF